MPVRIVIADDHKIVRDGLSMLIDKQHDFEVVGQAENGREAVELVRSKQPDVIIMDVMLPGIDGFAFELRLRVGFGIQPYFDSLFR